MNAGRGAIRVTGWTATATFRLAGKVATSRANGRSLACAKLSSSSNGAAPMCSSASCTSRKLDSARPACCTPHARQGMH
eukprot:6209604-Pleurochrysis_carterae.AAC.1